MDPLILRFRFCGEDVAVIPFIGQYGNGRLAVAFNDALDGSPFGVATVNLEAPLADGECFVKEWGGNEVLIEAMLAEGWLTVADREPVRSGHVLVRTMRPAGALLDHINTVRSDV